MESKSLWNIIVKQSHMWYLLHFQRGYCLTDINFLDSLTKQSLINPVFSLNCKPIFCMYNLQSIQNLKKCASCGNQIELNKIYTDRLLFQIIQFLKMNSLENVTIRLKDQKWSILQALQLGEFDIKYKIVKNNIITSKCLKIQSVLGLFGTDQKIYENMRKLYFSDKNYFEEDPVYLVKNKKIFYFDMIEQKLKQLEFIDPNGLLLKFVNVYLNKKLFVGQAENLKIYYSYLFHFNLKQNRFKTIQLNIQKHLSKILVDDWDLYLVNSSIQTYQNFMYKPQLCQTTVHQSQNIILVWKNTLVRIKTYKNMMTILFNNKQMELQFDQSRNLKCISFTILRNFLICLQHNCDQHIAINLKNESISKISFQFSVPISNIIFSDFIGRYVNKTQTLNQFFVIL